MKRKAELRIESNNLGRTLDNEAKFQIGIEELKADDKLWIEYQLSKE